MFEIESKHVLPGLWKNLSLLIKSRPDSKKLTQIEAPGASFLLRVYFEYITSYHS